MLDRPYIGITDIVTHEQGQVLVDVLRDTFGPFWTPRLGVGVMMSYKTLNGLDTKWSKAFPKNEDIDSIWLTDPDAFNVLHYADYDGNPLLPNMEKAMAFAGCCDAVQLDMIWPNPHDVLEFKMKYPDTAVIIQVNERALAHCSRDPNKAASYVAVYGGAVDVALLDMSMGTGKGLDGVLLESLVESLFEVCPSVSVAAAGGLGPDTLHLADSLFYKDPSLSLDAQSKLRPSGNALDPLDMDYCVRYLRNASARYGRICYEQR